MFSVMVCNVGTLQVYLYIIYNAHRFVFFVFVLNVHIDLHNLPIEDQSFDCCQICLFHIII